MFLKTTKKKGMTLIEIVISLAILAVLIIPVANLVIRTSDTSKRAQDKQKASLMGQGILEQIGNIDKDTSGTRIDYTDMSVVNTTNPDTNNYFDLVSFTGDTDIDCGNSRYKAKLSFEKQVDNNGNVYGPNIDTSEKAVGKSFFDNYSSSALALEFIKDSDVTYTIYNVKSNVMSSSININDKIIIVIKEDGECVLYHTNEDVTTFKDTIAGENLGSIDTSSSSKDILIHVVGSDKIIKSGGSQDTQYDKPFKFDSNADVGMLFKYDSDFNINITKGADISSDVKVKLATGAKKPHTISKNVYQSPTMMNDKIGNLYKVTVTISDTKLKGNDQDKIIFEGSTTCYLNK